MYTYTNTKHIFFKPSATLGVINESRFNSGLSLTRVTTWEPSEATRALALEQAGRKTANCKLRTIKFHLSSTSEGCDVQWSGTLKLTIILFMAEEYNDPPTPFTLGGIPATKNIFCKLVKD